uniref:CSON011452 protein n=1 Tax=Culicoides sonorensis TaxID=179676 RepID=A0A336LGV7_CULSO
MESDNREPTFYIPLKKSRSENDNFTVSPPKDEKNLVYISLLSCGIGFILPYSSFIVAADYWQERFRGKSVALDMSLVYILTACCTAFANSFTISIVPFKWRIILGYSISFSMLVFISVCEIAYHVFSKTTAYAVCLFAVLIVSFGSTIQQSCFYGFSSAFPNKYTQAVMAGESVAGLLVSTNRVITKLLISDQRLSTVIFFGTSIIYIGISYILHNISMKTAFVKYYINQRSKTALKKVELSMDTYESDNKKQKFPLSFSNPLYNPSQVESSSDLSQQPEELKEDILDVILISNEKNVSTPNGIKSRWGVAKSIYPYMTSIAIAYCVTLSLYPGIESEIISCKLQTWMPVLLMFTFNVADVVGKVLSAIPYLWSASQLILLSSLRIIIVPLLLLCCAPRKRPIITGEIPSFLFTAAFGLTNGLSGSLPMILAPNKVPVSHKELAGSNMMTLSYNLGMTIGSIMGYFFDNLLGEPLEDLSTVCPVYPYGPYILHTTRSTEKTRNLVASTLSLIFSTTQSNFEIEPTKLSTLSIEYDNGTNFYSTILNNVDRDNDTFLKLL